MKFYKSLVFVFFCFFSMVYAIEPELIVCKPERDKGSSGVFGLVWDSTTDDSLQSWRVELNFKINEGYASDLSFFWTYYSSSQSTREKGITLSVTKNLQLKVNHSDNGDKSAITEENWFTPGESYNMTLQFIVFQDEYDTPQKGEFSVITNQKKFSYTIENADMLQYAAFRKGDENFSATRFEEYNGTFQFSDKNISLYYLKNSKIPEPSTATMSLISTVFLVLRRRRR